jgi:dipeptidyl aminopeptidase/acylaminoacyl peptidase
LPDLESQAFPISENIVSIEEDDGDLHLAFTHVVTHNRILYRNSVWTEPRRFYFLHTPDSTSAPALWVCETAPGATPARVAFGDTDDAAGLVGVDTEAAVEVASGLETRIDIVGSTSFTAFKTSEDAFSSWDIRKVNGNYVFVAVRSSGVTGEPENIWSGSTVPSANGVLSTKLSSHHEWVLGKETPQCAPFSWSSEDGTALEGIVAYPRGQSLKNLPTVVVPHGGPYW